MSLTLDEARARAAMFSRSPTTSLWTSRPRTTSAAGSRSAPWDTFLEPHRGESVKVILDASFLVPAYDRRRIPIEGLAPGAHEVIVDARLRYVTDGEGLHTFTDPVGGERYVGGYLGLDITQRLFACFANSSISKGRSR